MKSGASDSRHVALMRLDCSSWRATPRRRHSGTTVMLVTCVRACVRARARACVCV